MIASAHLLAVLTLLASSGAPSAPPSAPSASSYLHDYLHPRQDEISGYARAVHDASAGRWSAQVERRVAGLWPLAVRAAQEQQIDPLDLLALVAYETGARPEVEGKLGEVGLGQIRWSACSVALRTAGIARKRADLWDPATNLRATALIVSIARAAARAEATRAVPSNLWCRYNSGRAKPSCFYASALAHTRTLIEESKAGKEEPRSRG